ncbi:hypothetical protein PUNSTDRAFT_67412, partial [Punctularia strigosozonata HHB-11173 SS5]|uniref:uncharacterized protein n=1 Tax=Punctularia strigosozonata (strain HHB-11173) TaxID=741275 RepID=UPI0004418695
TLKEIRESIPNALFRKSTGRAILYLVRDVAFAALFATSVYHLDAAACRVGAVSIIATISRCWWFQGLVFTRIWVIGHECGHSAFSDSHTMNNVVGFITHTALWTPYFSWKISHHRHHSYHGSMEKDEVYVPKTRADIGLPPAHHSADEIEAHFSDTPIYTMYMLIRQQLLGFTTYLMFNVSGQKRYPRFTNHFNPESVLFTKEQRNAVMVSNLGLAIQGALCYNAIQIWGTAAFIRYYGLPWLAVNHWFMMITYLPHTNSEIPHYRGKVWNFQRGAAATVDRNFLGLQGRLFLHDVAHFHVIHHFFPALPWYNGEEATKYLKDFIGKHYVRPEDSVFRVLWKTYNDCQFVDDEGDIVFYRNRRGEVMRGVAFSK